MSEVNPSGTEVCTRLLYGAVFAYHSKDLQDVTKIYRELKNRGSIPKTKGQEKIGGLDSCVRCARPLQL